MSNLHDKLMLGLDSYRDWHNNPHHVFWHWVGFLGATILIFSAVTGAMNGYLGDYGLFGLGSVKAAGISVPLMVTENAGIDRVNEPVSSGVPFPSALNLLTTNSLGVFDGGSFVPAQFKVLGRWGGPPTDITKPIKWILVDFQANISANTSKIYTLTDSGSGTAYGGITVNDRPASIVINTGAAAFTISKTQFNLFDNVSVADPATGQLNLNVLFSQPTAGASITRVSNGTTYYSANKTTSVAIEDSGPLHTVILATGRHQDSGGVSLFDWKVRIHFYNGKSYARVFYTITDKQDEPSITQNIPLSEVTLFTKLNTASNPIFTLAGDTGGTNIFTGSLATGKSVSLLQTGVIDQTGSIADDGNASTITYSVSGAAAGSGKWSRGWADLSDGTMGLTVAMNYFWQLYPKQFRLSSDGSLNIDIWPSGTTPLLMWAAAQKTQEMLYYFHAGTAAQAESDKLVNSLFGVDTLFGPGTSRHHNLFAIAPPLWYAQSRALGDIGVRDPAQYPSAHQALVTKYFNNVDALLERSLRERDSGGTRGGGHEYMFWNFGDSRDASWSNMAYDTLRADVIQFAASADRKFYDDLLERAQHWQDVDVEHSVLDTMPSETSRVGFVGTAPYLGKSKYNPNSGGEHDLGSFGRVGFNLEHLKGHGLADYYFLTGDSMSKDVLAETYNYYNMWSQIQQYADWGETRTWSNILSIMVGYYEVFGASEAKNRADGIVSMANTYQRRTTSANNPGLIWVSGGSGGGDAVGADTTSGFVNGHTMDILLDYMIQIPNSINETQNIIDAVTFEINDVGANRLWTGSYFNCWTGNNYGVPHASVCDYMSVGGFGFAYNKTGNSNILNIAKTALNNAIDQDSSNGNIKPYTQKTRIVPGFLYYLMSAGSAGGNPDTTAPTVPANLTATAVSSSQINLSWNASTDNVGVAGYRVYRGGVQIATTANTNYSDTSLAPATVYSYTVAAYDAAGNVSGQSAPASAVTQAASDTTPPTVYISLPASGATVSGTITVSANASDNVGVAGVQFKLDGTNLGAEDIALPYSISWNTATVGNGSHILTATARDAAGNTATSGAVAVTVTNVVPDTIAPSVPTGLTATAVSSNRINLSWTASTDNVGVSGYKIYRNGSQIGTSTTTSYQDTGLSPGTSYAYTVAAYDASGNVSNQSISINISTSSLIDNIPPTVSITFPTTGTMISGNTIISAAASDNVGVASVQFLIDSKNLGGAVTSSPYSVSWNTTSLTNGSYSITAIATDTSGNMTTSQPVVVTIANKVTTPTPVPPPVSGGGGGGGGSAAVPINTTLAPTTFINTTPNPPPPIQKIQISPTPTVTPLPPQDPAAMNLTGQYYTSRGKNKFANLVFTKNDDSINFDWGFGSPDGLPKDNFAIRWSETLNFPQTGVYTLQTLSDDGIRVWLDGTLILNRWYDHKATRFNVTRRISQGNHAMTVEYYQHRGRAVVKAVWKFKRPFLKRLPIESELKYLGFIGKIADYLFSKISGY